MIKNNKLMEQALGLARKAFDNNEVPVGAVIYDEQNQKIIGSGFNRVEQEKRVTLHAEIVAMQEACEHQGNKYLENSVIYTTLEPCSMCLTALSNARIKRVYYGAIDCKFGAIEGATNLLVSIPSLYKPECYGGFLERESSDLLRRFFKKLR